MGNRLEGRAGSLPVVAIVARGFAMGAADVVPGVSGGTMAFVLGIYEDLIAATRRLTDAEAWRRLRAADLAGALAYVDARLLLSVLGGIGLAVFSLAPLLSWALENHPSLVWAFFFGLVVASIWVVSRRLPAWTPLTALLCAAGAVGAWFLVSMVPVTTPDASWFLVLSGSLAICAMMLPGISGSFVLVLLGKYEVALEAVNDRDLVTLATLAIGAGLGLLLFARLLNWLLRHFHDPTIAALIGLMAGSLRKIWPWKETLTTRLDRHGELVPLIERNVAPTWDAAVLTALAFALVGLVGVLLLARIEARRS
ncbi:MAG: DUF368 domain-containing protein [Thermoanaerobaculia bacterium]|nr:DUF368 domain-containing protein [Thermoanaerobaculia bacterium]